MVLFATLFAGGRMLTVASRPSMVATQAARFSVYPLATLEASSSTAAARARRLARSWAWA